MVTVDAVKQGIVNYFENECARKAIGLGQFAAYFIAPSLPKMIETKMGEIRSTGMVDDIFVDGMVDIDVAADRARNAMAKCGSIELMGFKLNANDVDSLVSYIRSV